MKDDISMEKKSNTINGTSGIWSSGGRWCSSIFLFRILTSPDLPLQYPCFDVLWLQTNCSETLWLASKLSPVLCYYTDHTQLSYAVSFIEWGWLLSCFVEWDFPSITQCILCFPNMFCFIWNELNAFNDPLCYFLFLLLVFHTFMVCHSVQDLTWNYHMRSQPTWLVTTVFCSWEVRTACLSLHSQELGLSVDPSVCRTI
jgi:hypothetical protein